jgi:hypothetical protein
MSATLVMSSGLSLEAMVIVVMLGALGRMVMAPFMSMTPANHALSASVITSPP